MLATQSPSPHDEPYILHGAAPQWTPSARPSIELLKITEFDQPRRRIFFFFQMYDGESLAARLLKTPGWWMSLSVGQMKTHKSHVSCQSVLNGLGRLSVSARNTHMLCHARCPHASKLPLLDILLSLSLRMINAKLPASRQL